jgi:hypothetical protein
MLFKVYISVSSGLSMGIGLASYSKRYTILDNKDLSLNDKKRYDNFMRMACTFKTIYTALIFPYYIPRIIDDTIFTPLYSFKRKGDCLAFADVEMTKLENGLFKLSDFQGDLKVRRVSEE